MIALKDDPIWETVSAFGLPFRPFDFLSGMDIRDIKRSEATELDLITPERRIGMVALSALDEFKKRLEVRLRENLAKFENDEEKRRTDPLNFGTGDELLALAEEKIDESDNLTPEQFQEIKSVVSKAIERGVNIGFDSPPDDKIPLAELMTRIDRFRSLAFIYYNVGELEKATLYQQKAIELNVGRLLRRGNSYELIKTADELLANTKEIAPQIAKQILSLVEKAFEKGIGEKYGLREKADRILAKVRTN